MIENCVRARTLISIACSQLIMKRQDSEDNSGESSAEGTSETLVTPEGTESPKEQNTLTDSSPAVNSETDDACKRSLL